LSVELALNLNVLLTILIQPLQPVLILEPIYLGRILALAGPARLCHHQHETLTGAILLIKELQRCGGELQLARQG
jgi:hypothetical protein